MFKVGQAYNLHLKKLTYKQISKTFFNFDFLKGHYYYFFFFNNFSEFSSILALLKKDNCFGDLVFFKYFSLLFSKEFFNFYLNFFVSNFIFNFFLNFFFSKLIFFKVFGNYKSA
jgi:hypothetical protein